MSDQDVVFDVVAAVVVVRVPLRWTAWPASWKERRHHNEIVSATVIRMLARPRPAERNHTATAYHVYLGRVGNTAVTTKKEKPSSGKVEREKWNTREA